MSETTDSATPAVGRVLQLRVVVEADDFEQALAFYRDALGMPQQEAYEGDGGARVVILDAGRATLEIANPAQKRMIDDVEVGRQVAPRIRLAFEVADAVAVSEDLAAAGAAVVASPVRTPWRSLNARFDAPAQLHITVFEEPDAETAVATDVTATASVSDADPE